MILMFDGVGTFNEIFRNFFGGIDKLVYSLIGWVLQGIFNLSDLTANTGLVEIIYKRIYVVLAIFMVFKLTFSFLQYMINPESMTDKERGVGKIIVRIVIMLAMIVALPILFFEPVISVNGQDKTILTALQDGVIETLPRIILGINVKDDDNLTSTAAEQGKQMATRMLQAFYYPNACSSDNSTGTDYENSECYKVMENTPMNNLDDFSNSLLNDTNSDDIYDYEYMWPMSTIAGVLLVVILLGMAIDVAIRVFKLLILQLIAPVPVMSYIDPKSSKDGAFSSWTKNFVSTYLDIFIKLGTVYLLLLLFSEMFNLFDFGDSSGIYNKYGFWNGSFVLVFLILGLFKFAKDAPKFIKDAFGMKDSGGGGGFMGKALTGLAGAAAGFAGGVAAGGLAGGLSGIVSGYGAGAAGKPGQAYSQIRDEQAKLLGKTPGGLKGKVLNKGMQHSVKKRTGLNDKVLQDLKDEKLKTADELAIAEADYANGNITSDELKKARMRAGKAASKYEEANSLAKQIGMKPGFMQENKRHGATYIAAARLGRAIKESEAGIAVRNIPTKVSDKVESVSDGVREAYDVGRVIWDDLRDRDGAPIRGDREALRDAKSEYKEVLRGGIGNLHDEDDKKAAQKAVKDARKEYRDNF